MYSLLVTAGDPVRIRLLDWQLTRNLTHVLPGSEVVAKESLVGGECILAVLRAIVPTHALAGPLAASKMHPMWPQPCQAIAKGGVEGDK
jgi:hypothetical protein